METERGAHIVLVLEVAELDDQTIRMPEELMPISVRTTPRVVCLWLYRHQGGLAFRDAYASQALGDAERQWYNPGAAARIIIENLFSDLRGDVGSSLGTIGSGPTEDDHHDTRVIHLNRMETWLVHGTSLRSPMHGTVEPFWKWAR